MSRPAWWLTTAGRSCVEVLTQEKLVHPQVQHYVGQWVTFHEPKAKDGKLLYRAKSYYTLSENVVLVAEECDPARRKRVPDQPGGAAVQHRDQDTRVAEGRQDGSRSKPARRPRQLRLAATLGWPSSTGIAPERGLAPIQYDAEYARVSRVNNEMGGVHRYNTGWQTWASPSDPEAAVSMWMGAYYKSHGVIIMNPSITRGGTHSHPTSGTTFTGG